VWFFDYHAYRIRRLHPDGTITTVVGNGSYAQYDFAFHSNASFVPLGDIRSLTLDANCTRLWFALSNRHRVYVVWPNGTVESVVGTGAASFNGDGHHATATTLYNPKGVAVSGDGAHMWIADEVNRRVRYVAPNGTVATVVGNGSQLLSTATIFDFLPEVSAVHTAISPPQLLQLAANETVLWISCPQIMQLFRLNISSGMLSVVAGNGQWLFSGDGGPAVHAQLAYPNSLVVDASGSAVFIADTNNNRIRLVYPNGTIDTIAGSGRSDAAACANSPESGPARQLCLWSPYAIATRADPMEAGGGRTGTPFDQLTIWISETGARRVRVLHPNGMLTTLACTHFSQLDPIVLSGPVLDVPCTATSGLTVASSDGAVYFVDATVQRIRVVTPDARMSVAVGSGYRFDGMNSSADTFSRISIVSSARIAVNANGSRVFIADQYDNTVWLHDPVAKNFRVVAGGPVGGTFGEGGAANAARLQQPSGVVTNAVGDTLWFADQGSHRVLVVWPNGTLTRLAGNTTAGFSGDGLPGVNSMLQNPTDVAVHEPSGRIWIADRSNYRIRLLWPNGTLDTVAGASVYSSALPPD
ncbi:MAG: hypothetical protein EOO65_03810, partial [Methanosarcinales archaeon]